MHTLFEEHDLGGVPPAGIHLRNRLVRSATFEGMADPDGAPTEDLFKLYRRLARGGVGLIITGYAYVTEDGNSSFPGMVGIHHDALIPRYRALVDHVHEHGAAIALQIAHCGRQSTTAALGTRPIAPSAVFETTMLETPRAMTHGDIERVVDAFGHAARRARAAGFDAVQLHAAHGYLLNQFLCPHTNRRTDRYGGCLENRLRFVREVIDRCRARAGFDYPLWVKLSTEDRMRRGLRIEESAVIARRLAEFGVDALEVSCGIGEDGMSTFRGEAPVDVFVDTWETYRQLPAPARWVARRYGHWTVRPPPWAEAYNRPAARAIRAQTDLPLMLVGGLTRRETMDDVLASGDADYISLCRPLIHDSRLPEKLQDGRRTESGCIHCNLCVGYMAVGPVRCYNGIRRHRPG